MRFGIGPDMGFVLAKGIALSLLTVLLLMPALILRFQGVISRTQHRSFIPRQSRKLGELAYRLRKPVLAVVAVLIIPCYICLLYTSLADLIETTERYNLQFFFHNLCITFLCYIVLGSCNRLHRQYPHAPLPRQTLSLIHI